MSISTERDTKRPGQTEITNLEITSFVDQQILRFEISVKDTAAVAKVETFDELVREFLLWKPKGQPAAVYQGSRLRKQEIYLDHIKTKTFIFTNGIHILFQIHIKKLEHEVELCLRMHNIQQSKTFRCFRFFLHLESLGCDSLDNVVVLVQLFQQTDFPDRGAWHTFIFCFKTNPLEGDNVARFEIFGLEHDAIRTCFFYLFIYHLVIHLGRL